MGRERERRRRIAKLTGDVQRTVTRRGGASVGRRAAPDEGRYAAATKLQAVREAITRLRRSRA